MTAPIIRWVTGTVIWGIVLGIVIGVLIGVPQPWSGVALFLFGYITARFTKGLGE